MCKSWKWTKATLLLTVLQKVPMWSHAHPVKYTQSGIIQDDPPLHKGCRCSEERWGNIYSVHRQRSKPRLISINMWSKPVTPLNKVIIWKKDKGLSSWWLIYADVFSSSENCLETLKPMVRSQNIEEEVGIYMKEKDDICSSSEGVAVECLRVANISVTACRSTETTQQDCDWLCAGARAISRRPCICKFSFFPVTRP